MASAAAHALFTSTASLACHAPAGAQGQAAGLGLALLLPAGPRQRQGERVQQSTCCCSLGRSRFLGLRTYAAWGEAGSWACGPMQPGEKQVPGPAGGVGRVRRGCACVSVCGAEGVRPSPFPSPFPPSICPDGPVGRQAVCLLHHLLNIRPGLELRGPHAAETRCRGDVAAAPRCGGDVVAATASSNSHAAGHGPADCSPPLHHTLSVNRNMQSPCGMCAEQACLHSCWHGAWVSPPPAGAASRPQAPPVLPRPDPRQDARLISDRRC